MRIMLAEHEPNVRYAMRVLLERKSGYEIVGEIDNSEDLIAKAQATQPDLLLLHWNLRGFPVDNILPSLRSACPNLKVIALSGRPEVRRAAEAAGVDDFVSKMDPPEYLLSIITRHHPND